MLAPTPILRPSPLDIGGIFAGTFEVLKRRFGLLVLITLFPLLIVVVGVGVALAIAIGFGISMAAGNSRMGAVGIAVGVALYIVAIVAGVLAQLKSYGMLSAAAYEIAQGRRPDVRGLLTRTKGFLPRMAPIIAIGVGCYVLIAGLFFALAMGSMARLGPRGSESAAVAGAFIVVMLLGLLIVPAGLFLQTKLLYLLPAVAIEEHGGIDAIKRSWTLTRGAFWRTLGYFLVAVLAVYAVMTLISVASQFAIMPMLIASMSSMSSSSDPSAALAATAAMIPIYVIFGLLSLAAELLTVPFLQTYVTCMFIDQVRRSELPASAYPSGMPGYGYAQSPYYAQPGQYYGQPAPGYPQPGQPPQVPWPPMTPQPPTDQPDPPASS